MTTLMRINMEESSGLHGCFPNRFGRVSETKQSCTAYEKMWFEGLMFGG